MFELGQPNDAPAQPQGSGAPPYLFRLHVFAFVWTWGDELGAVNAALHTNMGGDRCKREIQPLFQQLRGNMQAPFKGLSSIPVAAKTWNRTIPNPRRVAMVVALKKACGAMQPVLGRSAYVCVLGSNFALATAAMLFQFCSNQQSVYTS